MIFKDAAPVQASTHFVYRKAVANPRALEMIPAFSRDFQVIAPSLPVLK
jgi:hypothetical protein